jgi:hypothetical protein
MNHPGTVHYAGTPNYHGCTAPHPAASRTRGAVPANHYPPARHLREVGEHQQAPRTLRQHHIEKELRP